jgi:hypothetical protein
VGYTALLEPRMWKQVFSAINLIHAVFLAVAAFGLFRFWKRTHFWLPKYIHVMAAIAFLVMFSAMSKAPPDAPVNHWGVVSRFLFSLLLPAIVYFFFILYGGQHVAFRRLRTKQIPCLFCGGMVAAQVWGPSEGTSSPQYVEETCPHCGQALNG